jgi:hypothetical protein
MTGSINIATLRDYLKTQLAADSTLSALRKSWSNGQPVVLPSSPFGWVRALGGAREPGVSGSKKTVNSFEIVVVVKDADVDEAEDRALAYLKAVEDLVDADPNLAGQVSSAWVSGRESQQWDDGRAHFSAWKVTVTTWRLN